MLSKVSAISGEDQPVSKKRIAFRDCDAFGMLYNTRFLDYILDTRYDHLIDQYGIDFLSHHYEGGRMFVIADHQASYFEPAKAHEEVLISTATIFVDSRSMIVEGAMTNRNGSRLKFHQWTRLRVLDLKQGKSSAINAGELRDLQRTMAGANNVDPDDYRQRVAALVRSMRG